MTPIPAECIDTLVLCILIATFIGFAFGVFVGKKYK